MTWKPNIVTRQAIQGFISDLFSTAPEIMGIDEAIAGCEVILMDPYTTGALPRYIRVRIREYYQDVIWRGTPNLIAGDFCTVLHFRDGNRYEVIGASGATGVDLAIPPYTYVWVYDVSEGLLISYDTINGALGYGPLAAGDFVLIPPGTFDESITLVNGVFICEQIPGTVTLDWTVASGVWTNGTVIVADGGYINVRNIYRTPAAGMDYNAVFVPAAFAGVCTIIAENIRSTGPGNTTYGIYFRGTGGGTLHVHAKTITAITPTGVMAAAYRDSGATATINLYVERGYASGATNGYGIWVASAGATVNVYGGEWEGIGGTAGYGWQVSNGTLTGLHARAIGSTADLYRTGGTLQIFQVQYNSRSGTITHLPGDHIVLDLDADTYITALAADDRIDLYVWDAANPTDFKFGPNNVITILDNIAQAFSIADAGGLEYMRIVSTNANPYVIFDPAGAGINVGIRTLTPGNPLQVNAAGNATNIVTFRNAAGGHRYQFSIDAAGNSELYLSNAAGAVTIALDTAGDSWFTGGNVGIGTPTPGYLADIEGDIANYLLNIFNDGNNDNRQGIRIQCGADLNPVANYHVFYDGNAGLIGAIVGDGAGGTTYWSASDSRLKNVLGPIDQARAMEALAKVDPIQYVGKGLTAETGHKNIGFSAQDIHRYFPEVAIYNEEADMYGISYERLAPVLWAQNQAMLKRIEALESIRRR